MASWGDIGDRPNRTVRDGDDPVPPRRYCLERSNTTYYIHQWSRFLWFWRVEGYIPNVASPYSTWGITYTLWGARRKLRKYLLDW